MKNISKLKLYIDISKSTTGEHKRKSYLLHFDVSTNCKCTIKALLKNV